MPKRSEVYDWIRVAGIVSFIPIILVSGAFAGYIIGEYLHRKFGVPVALIFLFIAAGTGVSVIEVVRIIKFAYRREAESKMRGEKE